MCAEQNPAIEKTVEVCVNQKMKKWFDDVYLYLLLEIMILETSEAMLRNDIQPDGWCCGNMGLW